MKDFIEFAKKRPSWALYVAGTAMLGASVTMLAGVAFGVGLIGLLLVFAAAGMR